MANVNSPRGARPLSTLASADFNEKANRYIVPASDTDNMFIGDIVKTNNTSLNGISIVQIAAAGDPVRGIIVGFENHLPTTQVPYRKGGDEQVVHVSDDPFVQFNMQVSGTLQTTDIGKFADIVVGTGNTANAFSTTQIDSTTIGTASKQIKILNIVADPVNEVGEYAKVICMFFEHELIGISATATADQWEQEDLTISGDGQTAFTLSNIPDSTKSFGLFLNGQLRDNPTDYTFTGTVLTWNDPGTLTIKTTDELKAWYQY